MRHLNALGVKFLMIAVVLGITLGLIGDASFGQVLLGSLVLTLVAYLIGDLVILPATQDWVAVAADAAIAWAVLRIAIPAAAQGFPLLLAIAALAGGEYFYHRFVKDAVLQKYR